MVLFKLPLLCLLAF